MRALFTPSLAYIGRSFLAIIALFHLAPYSAAQDQLLPLPPWPKNAQPGHGIQRTMRLLEESTAAQPHTVRILFYGQSITEDKWPQEVERDLRARYPHARLIVENRAIGGHSSERLVKTAEADLYPFQPDLLIFHVYGDHRPYEELLRQVRARTVAEVLLQSDHFNADHPLEEITDPQSLSPAQWVQWFNYAFLPDMAQKYALELIPQRQIWQKYLIQHSLEPKDLLRDQVHLNDHGNSLIAEIVKRHLRRVPGGAAVADARVTTYRIGEALQWRPGAEAGVKELELEFEGTRLDLRFAKEGKPAQIEVCIDGQKPSQLKEPWAFARATGYRRTNWPCLLRVGMGSEPLPRAETWRFAIHNANDDFSRFDFTVEGSLTGPDGSGNNTEPFVSRSGRLRIEPSDWNMAYGYQVYKEPHPAEVPIEVKLIPLHHDEITATAQAEDMILIQQLAPGRHTLTLRTKAKSLPPIDELRVYDPQAQ